MSRTNHASSFLRRACLVIGGGVFLILVVSGGILGYGFWVVRSSLPVLEGKLALAGLTAPVSVQRDVGGVPTIIAGDRADLARALGFLHGQERFFEMDLLRRAGAGELSALVGAAALPLDERRRLHRFRARAEKVLASLTPDQRAVGAAYAAGVNAGLRALGHAPWEYTILRVSPVPWTEADSSLVVYAMYFDLQDSEPTVQLARAVAKSALGPDLAAFLDPRFTPHDAPIDGAMGPEPPIPGPASIMPQPGPVTPPPPQHGSNNFAVAGKLTATGSAMVANDMHLGLMVPNIWYRARMVLAASPSLDLIGVTLPGTPYLVVGSNRHVAWGFTDAYAETGDAVVIEKFAGDRTRYNTPDGPRRINTVNERICVAHAACQDLPVSETIWGPITGQDEAGHPIVWAWTAHDDNAVLTDGFTGLEQAKDVRQALDAAHRAGLPHENLVVGDSGGHIGWTIIGQIPRRIGLDDQLPHSWADGAHGWKGYLSPAEIPEIIDPPSGRLWSANARTVGGDALQKLGDGGYADGQRAGSIRDDLNARAKFAEPDLLAIQTDTRAVALDSWQRLMLQAIEAHAGNDRLAALRPYVENWGGLAVPTSVGYRLVHDFRADAIQTVYQGLMQPVSARLGGAAVGVPHRGAWAAERLLRVMPASLVPSPYKTWNDVTAAILNRIEDAAGTDLAGFTWGKQNHTGIHHPLALAIPLLGLLTDPPDVPVAGDSMIPRVVVPGDGASERLVVSPGHEADGLFDMPMGQSANPLSPYFGAGQQAWVEGQGTKLMPGPVKWRLMLTP